MMNKLEHYTRLIKEQGLTEEILIKLLRDIGKANRQPYQHVDGQIRLFDNTDLGIDINDDGIDIDYEVTEYGRCNQWSTRLDHFNLYWEDLAKNFYWEE